MWACIGAGYAFGALSMLTIGLAVVAASLLATLAAARWLRGAGGLSGLLCGVALPLLYVALLNRQGPGEVCTSSAGGTTCTDERSPWPWLAAGLLLIAVALAVFARCRRIHRPTARLANSG